MPTVRTRESRQSRQRQQGQQAGRRGRWLRWLAVVLAVGAVGLTGWAVYFSTWFGVSRVVVVGTHRVSTSAVEQAAKVRLGQPIVRVDAAAIRHRVAAITQVESVVVVTQWPHTVRITVVERTPAAVVRQAGGGYELLDRDGVALGSVQDRPAGLALLDLDPATTPPATLAAASSVAASLTPTLDRKVRSITALTPNSVVLALTNGATVRWGDADQGAIKAEVLAALMKRPAAVYDVSAPYAPTTARG